MWGSTVDETQQLKLRQIDSLKQYFSNVKEIQRETLFEIAVSLPNRKRMTIRLTLPRDFPKVPPSLQVFPPVQHRLVDSQMLIIPTAHENLSRWSVHASLGKTVYEIIQKFMQDPPLIANTVATPTPGTTSPYPYPTTSPSMVPTSLGGSTGPVKLPYESKPLPQTPDQKPQTHIPLPVVPATFPELESKTPNELSQLLSDDAEFQKFFEALPQVQTMKKLRDDLRDNNESLAKKNLEREQEIEALRAEVGTKVANITERRASFNQKAKRQQEILEQFSTPALIDKLTDAASNAEEESDNLARRFLNGDVEQKDFVKEFMEKRKLYHLRSAKKESLAMIVR